MAEFLTTSGVSSEIESIIMYAKRELFLVSPFLQLSKTLFERLKDASKKGVVITIVYGKDELKPNERSSLSQLKNLQLYYFHNLHAKCYFNESKMVITSMNMFAFSERNNREMGVAIDAISDKSIFEKAEAETKSILNSADKIFLNKEFRPAVSSNKEMGNSYSKGKNRGYCIRCSERIDYNPSKPLCTECYSTWVIYANPEYSEDFCHKCGEFDETSMAKPECYHCYKG